MKRILLLAIALFGLASPQAHAMITAWGVGAINDSTTDFGAATKGGLGYGGGLLLDLHLMPGMMIESGGIYLANKYKDDTFGTSTTTGSIYVPVDLRIRIAGPLSIGGGFYYDDFLSSGYDSDDGWEAGVRLTFHPGIFIDARYLHGLKDQGGGLNYTSVIGLVGIRIF
jgi:hypothetical protein